MRSNRREKLSPASFSFGNRMKNKKEEKRLNTDMRRIYYVEIKKIKDIFLNRNIQKASNIMGLQSG